MYGADIEKRAAAAGVPVNLEEDTNYQLFLSQASSESSQTGKNKNTNATHRPECRYESEDEDVGPAKNNMQPGVENYVGKNIPVLILIVVKLLTQHITGFLIVIACFVASRAANERVRLFDRRNVSGRGNVQLEAIGIVAGLSLNLYLLFRVIMQEDGSRNVILFKPIISEYNDNLFTIIWIIVLSQFFVQFLEIISKASLALVNVSHARKGYLYGVLKYTMTTYRWILPIPQICAYLWSSTSKTTDAHTWTSAIFDVILIIIYVGFKVFRIKQYVVSWYHSFKLAISPISVGESITAEQIKNHKYKICPISHLPFSFSEPGARPVLITTVDGVKNIVSEQALYCWLNLQGANKKGFICPITEGQLEVLGSNQENKSTYRSSCTTSFHVFLM